MKPTIVLVHGAFAESASWDYVIDSLRRRRAPRDRRRQPAARPGRRRRAPSATSSAPSTGPSCSSRHSYGGAVISNVAADAGEIVGLVYVAAFAPDPGESCFSLAGRLPRQHARRCAAAGPAQRRHDRPVHRPGPLPRPVLRRRAGADRRRGWRRRSGRRPRRRSPSRPASGRSGASCRRGS